MQVRIVFFFFAISFSPTDGTNILPVTNLLFLLPKLSDLNEVKKRFT